MTPAPEHPARQHTRLKSWRFHAIISVVLFSVCFVYIPSSFPSSLVGETNAYSHGECRIDQPLITKKVAIIGAGSAGASTAYYLADLQSPCLRFNITIYERSNYVGGRSTVVHGLDNPDIPLELGGSIFVKANQNLYSAAKNLGLELQEAGTARPGESTKALGIWDGQKFRYVTDQSSSWWYDILKLIWHFGLAPVRTNSLMKQTVNTFLKMYQAPVFPFESLTNAANSLNLTDVTSMTGRTFLTENGIDPLFSNDIVQASTRVNYAQNLEQIHGLETMVCMATDGAVSVKQGNYQIFERMITRANATLLLNRTVTALAQTGGLWRLKSASVPFTAKAKNVQEEHFDAVVIAAPFQYSEISILPSSIKLPGEIPYVKLHVTMLTSPHRLAPAFFGLNSDEPVPEVILTTLPSDQTTGEPHFFSVSTLRKVTNTAASRDEYAYKIFSKSPVNSTLLSSLLGFEDSKMSLSEISKDDLSWTFEKIWHSYPYLPAISEFPDIKLSENLFYTGGIERFISTMETSSLMGRNVATLIARAQERDTAQEEYGRHSDM